MSRRARILMKMAVWVVCLLPLALLLYQFQTDNLGPNPISHVTNTLGDWTLRFLLASLALTPIRLLFGISWQMTLRRLLGLFAFFYACLHFTVWIVVDHFFDWPEMLTDIMKRPYITLGVLALTLLLPLAATSTAGTVKRLGGKTWRRLHRLVYAIGVLGVLHYLWLAKKGVNDPYWYAVALALLLGVRLWDWAQRAVRSPQSQGGMPRPQGRADNLNNEMRPAIAAHLTGTHATLCGVGRPSGSAQPTLGARVAALAGAGTVARSQSAARAERG